LEQLVTSFGKRWALPSENCICTGDIIRYGAQPEEKLTLFRNWEQGYYWAVNSSCLKGEERLVVADLHLEAV